MDFRPQTFDSLLEATRWQDRLDEAYAAESSGRWLPLASTAVNLAAAALLFAQVTHVSGGKVVTDLAIEPLFIVAGGFLLLLCVAYIGVELSRRSRDVTRNELRLLGRELQLLNVSGEEADERAPSQAP